MSRPQTLNEILGQDKVVENLRILINSATKRNDALPHMLFEGSPGLGKTTLAMAVANEMGVSIEVANGANLKSPKDIQPYLMRVGRGSVLFIDEIHSVSASVQEYLYPVMEDFRVDLGGEKEDTELSIDLEPFTIIGATTHGGRLLPPMYDRMKIKHKLQMYSVDNLSIIIESKAEQYGLRLADGAARSLAKASRKTPRIAISNLDWVRDCSITYNRKTIDSKFVLAALKRIDINPDGIDANDRLYIKCLKEAKMPMGVNTIAAKTGIPRETIEERIEPYLLMHGVIEKTQRGRIYAYTS